MPSKKKTARAALAPQPTQSDYDTDTANITDAVPAPAPPSARTNMELNFLVLRRYVPDIEGIISIAPFAVVYVFSPETQQWEKSGVEGTLFVCQLSRANDRRLRYSVVILNRKSLDNFVTELTSAADIEITEEYVILQVMGANETPHVYGLWIFSDEGSMPTTREVVANAIQECAVRAEQSRGVGDVGHEGDVADQTYHLDGRLEQTAYEAPAIASPQSQGKQIDLLSLFNKAPELAAQNGIEQRIQPPPPPQEVFPQPQRFASTADTDFFRVSNSPVATQRQQVPPPAQSNTLLDLFKNAKKG